jgi:WD40 repeat protein
VRVYEWKGSLLILSVSPDRRTLAASTQENAIHLWDAESAEDFQMSGYPTKVTAMAWRHDSRYFATGAGATLVILSSGTLPVLDRRAQSHRLWLCIRRALTPSDSAMPMRVWRVEATTVSWRSTIQVRKSASRPSAGTQQRSVCWHGAQTIGAFWRVTRADG